ncbi:hypothetical protein NDU88_006224 [Pleurodeles waltl]|uniref:Uncharacterized protein n=1 Tax=Pleurodeles waltl TaxID=8319 RepID=A0AAV7PI09_PLEWA|nr:hypothetical protein NDU88_006224 [Pleurodeles waltl]
MEPRLPHPLSATASHWLLLGSLVRGGLHSTPNFAKFAGSPFDKVHALPHELRAVSWGLSFTAGDLRLPAVQSPSCFTNACYRSLLLVHRSLSGPQLCYFSLDWVLVITQRVPVCIFLLAGMQDEVGFTEGRRKLRFKRAAPSASGQAPF